MRPPWIRTGFNEAQDYTGRFGERQTAANAATVAFRDAPV